MGERQSVVSERIDNCLKCLYKFKSNFKAASCNAEFHSAKVSNKRFELSTLGRTIKIKHIRRETIFAQGV